MVSQEKFIEDRLNIYNESERSHECKISIKTLDDILTKKYFTGADMKRVSCLFNTLISESSLGPVRAGLYMPDSVKEWLKIMKKINENSSSGFVYITDIYTKDIQVIIKVPQNPAQGMIREYYIGLMAINKLRYIVPIFMYTLSAFICNNTYEDGKDTVVIESCTLPISSFLILEKIPGNSMKNILKTKKITFNAWLLLFAQLLLGLEVAQREINFTHFDLHAGNVMIRTDKDIKYNIPLDTMTYKVHSTKQVPVVIDFGTSSVKVDSVTIGNDNIDVGVLDCMVPGYDVYKFLCSSAYYSKDLSKKIIKIFSLYGVDDPYDVVKTGVEIAMSEYCAKATFSKVASYTPLMFFKLLYNNPKYHKILKSNITVESRMEFISIQYPEVDNIENCITLQVIPLSYILTEYNIHILKAYNKILKSKKIQDKINLIRSLNNPDYIKIDNFRLENVFNIVLPYQHVLDKAVSDILEVQIGIGYDKVYKTIKTKALEKALNKAVEYQKKLEPYLQVYYTILELKLFNITWQYKFEESELFRFYKANVDTNNRAIRWSITLADIK